MAFPAQGLRVYYGDGAVPQRARVCCLTKRCTFYINRGRPERANGGLRPRPVSYRREMSDAAPCIVSLRRLVLFTAQSHLLHPCRFSAPYSDS